MYLARSPVAITLAVWRALFLREAVSRVATDRGAWLWLILEPAVHVGYLVLIYTVVRVRVIGGIDTALWVIVGMLTFFLFRRSAVQGMIAVAPNRALFTYRQVKPVDAVLVRAALEAVVVLFAAVLIFAAAGLSSMKITPEDPLLVLQAMLGVWLVGIGFGLIASVATELVPELGRLISLAMTPLYFLSGVMFPVWMIPPAYRDWLMLNPLVHALEAARVGFAPYYQAVPGLNLWYTYAFALVVIFIGLALHRRFATRLLTS